MTSSGALAIRKLQSITRIDGRRVTDPPGVARVALAGVAAVAASLLVDVLLVLAGTAAFHPPASFGPFSFPTYAALTVVGVVGATAFWAGAVRVSSQPRWVLGRAAVVVTALLLIPDVLLLPHDPTGGVMTLMAMHIAIAVVTTAVLLTVAPAVGQRRSMPPAGLRSERPVDASVG